MAEKGIYGVMAEFYDSINGSLDYKAIADFCENTLLEFSKEKPSLILDAACGTGIISVELAQRGYDMTGVDISPEMLSRARERASEAGLDGKILFLCQDLSDIDLYGTVDAVICTLDSINHITDKNALSRFFSLLHRCYLIPEGIFIFDINTPYKFENVYGINDFILEDEGMYCGWQNYFDRENGLANFYLTVFRDNGDGTYTREETEQEERCYSMGEMKDMLNKTGFDILAVYSDFEKSPALDSDERWYFVCKNRAK